MKTKKEVARELGLTVVYINRLILLGTLNYDKEKKVIPIDEQYKQFKKNRERQPTDSHIHVDDLSKELSVTGISSLIKRFDLSVEYFNISGNSKKFVIKDSKYEEFRKTYRPQKYTKRKEKTTDKGYFSIEDLGWWAKI